MGWFQVITEVGFFKVKIRWKITTASFALRNFPESPPTIIEEKEMREKNRIN